MAAAAVALAAHYAVYRFIRRAAVRSGDAVDFSLLRNTRRPARVVALTLVLFLILPHAGLQAAGMPEDWIAALRHGLGLGLIGAGAWLLVGALNVARDTVTFRYRTDVPDNLEQRRLQTQVQMAHRILVFLIVVSAVAAMLMTFEEIQRLGVSLLASAGIAGVIIGIAAQPALATIIAGVQLAVSQPIRIDDVVVVEGEWGRVEEIGASYVVVRLWDRRSLIVPVSHFLEKPFQNWTRREAGIIGSVRLHLDYSVPVGELREQLAKVVAEAEQWDGEICNLQVVDATDRTMVVRAVMSAPNSPAAWDLRCHVREQLIGYVHEHYPDALPKVRTATVDLDDGNTGAVVGSP